MKDGAQGAINDFLAKRSGTVFDMLRSIFMALSPLGLAALVLAICVAGVVIHAYFDVRRRTMAEVSLEPAQAPTPPEPLASSESAERLLDLFKHWERALFLGATVLENEICACSPSSKEVELLFYAIRAHPLETSRRKLSQLSEKFEYFLPRQTAQSVFDTRLFEVRQTLEECNFQLVFWINKGGAVTRGEELLSSPTYIRFYQAYQAALEAARLLQYHSELGRLAKTLMGLESKPTSPADPRPSTASEQVPPPSPESSG